MQTEQPDRMPDPPEIGVYRITTQTGDQFAIWTGRQWRTAYGDYQVRTSTVVRWTGPLLSANDRSRRRDTAEGVIAEINRLIFRNAQHRTGFRLSEVTPPFILEQAQRELDELKDAPADMTEFADLLGVLYHYAIRMGWSMDDVHRSCFEKFSKCFVTEGDTPAAPPAEA